LPDAPSWFESFDVVQLNEEEMRQRSDDPLGIAAHALARGTRALLVTLGPRGVAYVADAAFDGFGRTGPGGAIRSARLAPPLVDAVDPTGCGDVFGAATMGRLLAGDTLEAALHHGNRLAARNATLRGASDLAPLLRGALVGA
jgi:sugar/nucleoside kinase (ribokinase family)